MSELAFNLNGERFDPPDNAAGWRVRRLKAGGRGTPEVVYGDDGGPLVISVDCDRDQLRQLLHNESGRYRLDLVDENHRMLPGAIPAYMNIAPEQVAPPKTSERDDLVRDLVRVNAEMVKNITDRFATVIEAAAQLIRAADGAGLPAREPMAQTQRNATVVEPTVAESGDQTDDNTGEILKMVSNVIPTVTHCIHTRVLGLSADQSLAIMGVATPANGNSSPPATSSSGPEQAAVMPPVAEPRRQAATGEASGTSVEPTKDLGSHMIEIEKLLTPEDMALARIAVLKMPPDALADWRERLLRLSAGAAAALIRAEIHRGPR